MNDLKGDCTRKRKFFSILLVLVIILAQLVPVSASTQEPEPNHGSIWLVENGVGRPISYEEYLDLLEPEIDNTYEVANTLTRSSTSYTFARTSQYTYYGNAQAVSPAVLAPGSAIAMTSVTITASYSRTMSATLKGLIKGKLTLNVTVAESASSATGSAAGGEFPAKPDIGKYCRVYFQPKLARIEGTVTESTQYNNGHFTDTYDGKVTYPVTLSGGLADGICFASYTNTPRLTI